MCCKIKRQQPASARTCSAFSRNPSALGSSSPKLEPINTELVIRFNIWLCHINVLGSHLSFREVKIRSLTATSTCTSGAPLDDWWSWCQWRRWRLLGVLYSFSNALACSRVSHTWAWEWPSSSLDCHHVLRAGVHLRDNLLWPGRHCLTSYLERFRLWWIPLFLRCWWRPRLWTSFPAI